jgi:hypothetical protein
MATDSVKNADVEVAPSGAIARVAVRPPFQVCHDGVVFGPNEVAEVPEEVAAFWITHGWVEAQ